jgi:transposase-like protein
MDTVEFERLLGQLSQLSRRQCDKVQEALNRLSAGEQTAEVIQTRFAGSLGCPHCGATHLHRHGQAHGLQRYRCTACGKTFKGFAHETEKSYAKPRRAFVAAGICPVRPACSAARCNRRSG